MYKHQSSMDDSGTKLTGVSSHILALDGTIFESFKKALTYMEQSDQYDEEDSQNLNDLSAQLTETRKQGKSEWKEVNSLPRGWKASNSDSKQIFLSPNGETFSTRRVALKFMIDNDYPRVDINQMRACLKLESWKDDSMLPNDWKYKKIGTREIHFLSGEGDLITGVQNAKKYLTENKEHDPDQLDGFNMFADMESARTRTIKYTWSDGDTTIPEGWKSRQTGSKTFFLSPEGLSFSSRRAAFQHMIKYEGDKEELEEMRTLLAHEGWELSRFLPEGWLHKTGSATGGHNQLLTMEGNMIESYKLALDYMKSLPYYSSSDLEGITSLMEDNAAVRRLSNMEGWSTSPTVPGRWRVKNSGQTKKEFFLGPDGRSFPCRKAALQHMIGEHFPSQEIEEMRQCLKHEGWEGHKNLPEGWKMRSKGRHKISESGTFLSPEGVELKSSVKALEHMKSNSYSEEDIKGLKMLLGEFSVKGRMANYEWEEDDTVPHGWKSRVSGQKIFFLSPDGQGFPCRKNAYIHMIAEKYSQEEVEDMRKLLRHENYEIHSNLPMGWRIKYSFSKVNQTNMSILSSEGHEFKSFLKAHEYLQSNGRYDKSNVEDLKMLCDEKATERRQGDSSWEEDPSVPRGWKMRVMVEGKAKSEKEFFLAPDGRQFPGRRVALKTMVDEGFAEDVIAEMRSKLVFEGWQATGDLPDNWFVKDGRQRHGHQFVADTGDRLKSAKAAMEFIQARQNSNIEDINRLMKFTKMGATEVQVKQEWEKEEDLPEGWRVRRVKKGEGLEELEIFLTPYNQQLFSRKTVLDHLLKEGYSSEQVDRAREGMKRSGWEVDPGLPPGFLRRSVEGGRKLEFLTPTNQKLEGQARLLEYLLDQVGHSCVPALGKPASSV